MTRTDSPAPPPSLPRVSPSAFDPASRSVLSERDLGRFEGSGLFQRVARALCRAECLPRKELYESWEVARRARRRFRGGRVLDLACGHAVVAHLMLVLDDSSAAAVAIDARLPSSAYKVADCFAREWPRLSNRIELMQATLESAVVKPGDVVVSCHACGTLTDDVLNVALEARARVVVLPCCHDAQKSDLGGLSGWLDPSLAIDVTRVARLRAHGYTVHTQLIPATITPKNRLILAEPSERRDPP